MIQTSTQLLQSFGLAQAGGFGIGKSLWGAVLFWCLTGLVLAQSLQFSEQLYEWLESTYGASARLRAEQLQELMANNSQAPEQDKLQKVNAFFNRIRYASDFSAWDQKDYWATPFEVLGLDAADCEDYALSKYFTLTGMGVDEAKLRITYVKAIELDQAHMVLAYYPEPNAEPLILDNLTDQIELAGQRDDLVPVYSFNGSALWLSVNRLQDKPMGGPDQLTRWRTFQQRFQDQMAGKSAGR